VPLPISRFNSTLTNLTSRHFNEPWAPCPLSHLIESSHCHRFHRLKPMELKDLGPLLLQHERESSQDIDVELLTITLRGGHAANTRRKDAEAAISHHVLLSRREAAFQNHTQRYAGALEKTYHYVKLIQSSNVDSDAQQTMYDAIGEKLPIQVHRSMFIPTLENHCGRRAAGALAAAGRVLPDPWRLRSNGTRSRLQHAGGGDYSRVRQEESRSSSSIPPL
jgi:hypothetical protein